MPDEEPEEIKGSTADSLRWPDPSRPITNERWGRDYAPGYPPPMAAIPHRRVRRAIATGLVLLVIILVLIWLFWWR